MKVRKLRHIILISLSLLFFSCNNSGYVLIVGDSLFSGYGLNEDAAPVSIIKKNLHRKTIEFCEPGLTLSAFYNRLGNYDNLKITHVINIKLIN